MNDDDIKDKKNKKTKKSPSEELGRTPNYGRLEIDKGNCHISLIPSM